MKTEQITTSKEEKIKTTVYISTSTEEKVKALLTLAGVDSANKFYVKAIEKYVAELMVGDGNNYITATIAEAVAKGCDKQLRYIADALFRYAVFGNVSIEMMARALDYDLDELNECYREAKNNVRRTRGMIPLERIAKHAALPHEGEIERYSDCEY